MEDGQVKKIRIVLPSTLTLKKLDSFVGHLNEWNERNFFWTAANGIRALCVDNYFEY